MNFSKTALITLAVALQFVATGRAADFTVIHTNDFGPGSLRQAILDANLLPGADRVVFNIPGPGVQVIEIENDSLPAISDQLTIDGYTQPGASPNTLSVGDNAVILIQLRKHPFDFIDGLVINAGGCVIRGLSITGFGYGRTNNYTGGGIIVSGAGGSTIEGNFIGVAPDGQTAFANVVGIRVLSTGNLIGGSTPAARNVISGNTESGVFLLGDNIHNMVLGNYVGTDASGSRAVANGTGVWFSGNGGQPGNILGGTAPGTGNVISGNLIGVGVGTGTNPFAFHTTRNIVVQGNLIGTAANGVDPLGNVSAGIFLNGIDNLIGGLEENAANTIAFNDIGVSLQFSDSASNRILSNRMYGNSTIGIDLGGAGPTPNDPGDTDGGPNGLQNFPVITSSSSSAGTATINGTLNSTPNTQFILQFFADSQSLTRTGQSYLGSENVTTDGNGNASFSVTFPNADDNVVFNATATDANGNTSEFSRNQAHLLNVSARLRVQAGDNALLAGLIQRVARRPFVGPILRALGPSLTAFGISDPLPDPTLTMYNESGMQTAFNDNWKDDPFQRTTIQFSGFAPSNDLESAMIPGLGGFSTAVVRDKGDSTGISLLEMFDRDAILANFSVRGLVETGDNVMIAGFIIDGGVEPLRLVVRALGPSLAASGIANPLPDPVLELRDGNGRLIESNDNWRDRQEADLQTINFAPSNNSESAILTRLGPGAYTAILRGKGSATGVALLEYYNLP